MKTMEREMRKTGWRQSGKFWYLPEDMQLMTYSDAVQLHKEVKKGTSHDVQ